MSLTRKCSRAACSRAAVATLTYVYADQTAVVGPLATYAEPHTYDLCVDHAERLTVPRGWQVVRLAGEYTVPEPSHDDLLALANAVREAAKPRAQSSPVPAVAPVRGASGRGNTGSAQDADDGGRRSEASEVFAPESSRRGHLRVLRDL
ncbi:MAG TPA: DUF3499 domain-containing protein [Dermatophilaceae bacterium]|nr:DUF3499 domain-containing protein [Dermatophilaceae bacterium]